MKHPVKKIILTWLAVMGAMALHACTSFGAAVSGVVVDEATAKPVADAIVVVRWHGRFIKGGPCYYVATTRTNAEGRYLVSAWIRPWHPNQLLATSTGIWPEAYKPGHVTVFKEDTIPALDRIVMTAFRGTKDEYFDRVLSLRTWACDEAGVSQKSLRQLYVAAARDAATLAETQNQERIASFLARRADDPLDDQGYPTKY